MAAIARRESRKAIHQSREGLRGLESREMGAETEMATSAEGLVMRILTLDVEAVRLGIDRRIAVRGRERYGKRFSLSDFDAIDFDVLVCDATGIRNRSVVSEDFLDCVLHQVRAGTKFRELLGILQQCHDCDRRDGGRQTSR